MEIRGAGELLGDNQSGQMHEIGFNLYVDMLNYAVKQLKIGKKLSLDDPLQKIPKLTFIPQLSLQIVIVVILMKGLCFINAYQVSMIKGALWK